MGQFPPSVHLDATVRGKGRGAAKGAASAFDCLQAASGDSTGIGAAIAILCMPIVAAAGAIAGASKAAPAKQVEQAETQLDPELKARAPAAQKALEAHLVQYASEVGLVPFAMLEGQGPTKAIEAPEYRLDEGENAALVMEIALLDITALTSGAKKLDYGLVVSARGRIVRPQDNAVLDSFYHRTPTATHSPEEWTADRGKLLAAELDRAYRSVAEAFIDEWLLVERRAPAGRTKSAVHGETETGTTSKRLVPVYMLHPIYPAVVDRGIAATDHDWPVNKIQIDNRRPLLRWESFPRPQDFADPAAQDDGPRNVVYDLRLFRGNVLGKGAVAARSYQFIVPGELLLSEAGLSGPSFQLPELEPCTVYLWTVRARYLLGAHPQATEWTWPSRVSPRGPTEYRRTWPTWSDYPVEKAPVGLPSYVPFGTPPRDGEKCDLR